MINIIPKMILQINIAYVKSPKLPKKKEFKKGIILKSKLTKSTEKTDTKVMPIFFLIFLLCFFKLFLPYIAKSVTT